MNHHLLSSIVLALAFGSLTDACAQKAKAINAAGTEVKPSVSDLPVSSSTVTDLHLRPLFTTTIRLPEPVTSVAVGAPTLFDVEHSDEEPRTGFREAEHKRRGDQQFDHRSPVRTGNQYAPALGRQRGKYAGRLCSEL